MRMKSKSFLLLPPASQLAEARKAIMEILPDRLPSTSPHLAIRFDASKSSLLIANKRELFCRFHDMDLGRYRFETVVPPVITNRVLFINSYRGNNVKKLVVNGPRICICRRPGHYGLTLDVWRLLLADIFHNVDEITVKLLGYKSGSLPVVVGEVYLCGGYEPGYREFFETIMEDLSMGDEFGVVARYIGVSWPLISIPEGVMELRDS